jgi:hypothetical protein
VKSPIPPSDPTRPEPKCNQIWSAASPTGRRYIRIESVRLKGKEDNYVNVIECGRRGGRVHAVVGTLNGLAFYIVTPGGAMPSAYSFEAAP